MTVDKYYRGDDIKLPYEFQNSDETAMDLTNIIISVELRKNGEPLRPIRGIKIIPRVIRNINGYSFEVFISRDFTKILAKDNNYSLLVKLDDSSPHLTTWDDYPFMLL